MSENKEGVLTEILYENEINGYMVANFKTDRETIIITGYLPFTEVGDKIKITGEYVENEVCDKQFKVYSFENLSNKKNDEVYELLWENYSKIYKEQYGEEPDKESKDEYIRMAKIVNNLNNLNF